MNNNALIFYWAHMLDEALGAPPAGKFITDKSSIEDMVKQGLPADAKNHDIFEYSESGVSVVFVCKKDWPGLKMTCIVGGFIFCGDRWKPLNNARTLQKYKDVISSAMEKLVERDVVWVPLFDKQISKSVNLKLFKWDPFFWYKDILGNTDLFRQNDTNGFSVMDLAPQSKLLDIEEEGSDIIWLRSDEQADEKIRDLIIARLGLGQKKCKGESYFEVWRKQRGHGLDDICLQLAKKIDEKVLKTFGGDFAKKAAEFLADARKQDKYWIEYDEYPFDFSKLVNRREWWDLIPDQVYKAIVSRAAHPERSRGVSARVVYDCLDRVCHNISILYAQSRKIPRIFEKSSFYASLLAECVKAGLTKYDANNFMEKILESCGSYIDQNTFKYDAHSGWTGGKFSPISNTDFASTFAGFFNILDTIRYDEQNTAYLIGQLSMLIDQAHTRGSIAGAFVEGGAAVCSAVSNMKPDELYERAPQPNDKFSTVSGFYSNQPDTYWF